MENGVEFFTATCLKWQPLLDPNERKDIIINSLKFLVEDKRIWLYGFIIMPNHIHLMWCKQHDWLDKNVKQMFLKYTAQQVKFNLLTHNPKELDSYISTQKDRNYHFWERRSYTATMYNRDVASQKINYIHNNPVKEAYVLCRRPINIHQQHFISVVIITGGFYHIMKGNAVGEEHQQRRNAKLKC